MQTADQKAIRIATAILTSLSKDDLSCLSSVGNILALREDLNLIPSRLTNNQVERRKLVFPALERWRQEDP